MSENDGQQEYGEQEYGEQESGEQETGEQETGEQESDQQESASQESTPMDVGTTEVATDATGVPSTDVGPAQTTDSTKGARRPRRRTMALAAGVGALALVTGLTGYGLGALAQDGESAAAAESIPAVVQQPYGSALPDGSAGGPGSAGWGTLPGTGSGTDLEGSDQQDAETTQSEPTEATDADEVGVVTIDTDLYYGSGEAAGTGIVYTSDGTIITNNHVIEGATTITVTIESTGESFEADVVGTDATNDVAVLQLIGATGLETIALDESDQLEVGDEVSSIGNAEGTGALVVADGSVSSLEETITVSDELTGEGKELEGLIEVDAYVVSGDSGGPLVDEDGEVVGIVTAASSGSVLVTGYAIPIESVLAVVEQIEAGVESGTVTLGAPAFLGIVLEDATDGAARSNAGPSGQSTDDGGAVVGTVIEDTPAAEAGLAAGDTITALDGVAVASGDELSEAIAAHDPGDSVSLSYLDDEGNELQVQVTLIEGPAA